VTRAGYFVSLGLDTVSADPLKQPRAELAVAARAIEDMRAAASMDEFESQWRIYLNAIEKIWLKVEGCCQPMRNAFQPWQGQYHALRKKDMLLRYIKQARDADNHSIQDITAVQAGSRSFRFVNPQGGYIKRLEVRRGEVVHYEGDPMIVEDRPPHPVAVKVKNHGEWFNPPSTHLDQPVPNHHPLLLAELAYKFYSGYVDEVARKFFNAEPQP
jgi:hypothetical protein